MTGVKNILLLRHAKSAWDMPHESDHDRPLNDRGERAARGSGSSVTHRYRRYRRKRSYCWLQGFWRTPADGCKASSCVFSGFGGCARANLKYLQSKLVCKIPPVPEIKVRTT